MLRRFLTLSQANEKIQKLVGMPVSLPWKGYGSAIFFALGELSPGKAPRRHPEGQATIHIGWDWRVEEDAKVVFGSSNSRPAIERGIQGLCLVNISTIAITGKVPELLIGFSNGQRLISAAMLPNGSAWSISLDREECLSAEGGVLYLGDGSGLGLSPEEEAAFEHAHQTAERWGVTFAEPIVGSCRDCKWMTPIDGDADFLDYGVCTCPDSPFDARVINIKSGCPAFARESI